VDHRHSSSEKGIFVPLISLSRGPLIPFLIQILDLESRNAALQDDLSTAPAKRANHTDWLPRNPPAHTLTSHRAPITQVAFHPQYSVLASASEDATVKIWDWETGEFERTLKGHTKSVNDLNFDHKGHLLGISSLSLSLLILSVHLPSPPVTCSSDLFIKIWDSQSEYKNTKTFPGHEHSVSSVRFMPGDQHIISASRDKTIRLFDVPSTYAFPCPLPSPSTFFFFFSATKSAPFLAIQNGFGVLPLLPMAKSSPAVPKTKSASSLLFSSLHPSLTLLYLYRPSESGIPSQESRN